MQRLFIVLILIVAAILGLGYYLEWFTVTVDKDKFVADRDKLLRREPGNQDETDKLQGTWKVVSLERDGKAAPDEAIREQDPWIIKGDKIVMDEKAKDGTSTYKVDPAKTPKTIDVASHDRGVKSVPGIYSVEGDTLKVCLSSPANKERPTEFSAKEGSKASLYVLERQKP
jgi:uncharacterized protein (TIGR03067 family)